MTRVGVERCQLQRNLFPTDRVRSRTAAFAGRAQRRSGRRSPHGAIDGSLVLG
ncbi:MAG: hypothetical protein P8Y92_05270 [Halioglobus sp.]